MVNNQSRRTPKRSEVAINRLSESIYFVFCEEEQRYSVGLSQI